MALQPIISQLGGGLSSVTGPSVGSDAPVGANLGVSDIDMGYGQTPINPNFGNITAQVKPNVPQGLVFDEAKGWVQPNQATNTMPSPIDNFGQTPINPDLSKLDMTGMSYANEQPIGGFAAPAYFPNNQLISGNTMQLPTNVATNPLSTYGTQTSQNYVTPPTLATAGSQSGGSFTQGAPLPNITTTHSQATAAPQFYTDYLSNLASQGQQAASGSSYVGAQPLQQQAFNQVGQNVGNYQPALQNAINLANSVGGSNLAQTIGDVGQANIARNLAPQATAGIVGSGQFGSTRGATALGDVIANAELGITQQQALALQQDYANRLNASAALGNLASQTQALGLGDVNALATLGGQQQTIAQNEQLFPMQQLTNQAALLRGYQMPTSTSSTYTGPIPGAYSTSPLQQIAGLGALSAGILGTNVGQGTLGSSLGTYLSGLFGSGGNPTSTPTEAILNNSPEGTDAYGWQYFNDGTAISPDGTYYYQGNEVYTPPPVELP